MTHETTRPFFLVDTSIVLEGGEAMIASLNQRAWVFVTDTVLQELDGHKNNVNTEVAYRAREFFRRLGKENSEAFMVALPNGMQLEARDTVHKMSLGATSLYVMVRKPYKSKDSNDSKIIEIAKDYGMHLITVDMAQRVRAMSEGVRIEGVDFNSNGFAFQKVWIQRFLNFTLFLLFFSFFANIGYTLFQPLKIMDIAQAVQVGFALGVGMLVVFFFKFFLFEATINEVSSRKEKRESMTDWHTNPCDNLLIGNTFYSSIHD